MHVASWSFTGLQHHLPKEKMKPSSSPSLGCTWMIFLDASYRMILEGRTSKDFEGIFNFRDMGHR